MKHLTILCLSLLLLLPLCGFAEEGTVWHAGDGEVWNDAGEHFAYVIEGDHAVLIGYRVDTDKPQPAVVAVPSEVNGVPLTAIGGGAFNNSNDRATSYDGERVERIVIPEGVTELRGEAFICAHDVRRIELPSTLTVIEEGASYTFHHVSAEIDFPGGSSCFRVEDGFLIDTRTDALIYCGPSSYRLPLPQVRRIEASALEYYSQFQTVLAFPDGVEYIGSMNAYDCVNLETIIVPGSVVELADDALKTNTAKEIILNEGLRRIGAFAFAETEITEITIPSTVEWIGAYAFDLTYMEFEDNLPELNCYQETEEEYEMRCLEALNGY